MIREFLEELNAADIKVWTDGDKLRCNAPQGALTPDLQAAIKARKSEIIAFLRAGVRDVDETGMSAPPIGRAPRQGELSLSFTQQRFWFVNKSEPDNAAYNIFLPVRLTGTLNTEVLEGALREIIQRHEVLRTRFVERDGIPRAVIDSACDWKMDVHQLSGIPEPERMLEVTRLASGEYHRPSDLTTCPSIRASLLQLDERDHVLLIVLPHIAADGWSLNILFNELGQLYPAFLEGRPSPLPELPVQYADYADWHTQWLDKWVLEAQLPYWKRQLVETPPELALPLDRPRPSRGSSRGARYKVLLSKELTAFVHALRRGENATLFMVLLAAFDILLSRYSRQNDICVGTTVASRNRPELENLIGPFINNLVLRTDLSGDPSVTELIASVREVVMNALAHQEVPFGHLVKLLHPRRHSARSPFFQVMFTLHNYPVRPLEVPGLTMARWDLDIADSRFDLALDAIEADGSITLYWEYNSDLFEASTIHRMHAHFERLLAAMISDPRQRISTLPMLTEAELSNLMAESEGPRLEYARDACVHRLFEQQASATPDSVAVVCGGDQIAYGELNHRANQLANYLRTLGVGPEVLVGLCLERSLDMVVALLGILKAGGAYVPLDPQYPQDRLAFMLEDSRAAVLVTEQRFVANLPPAATEVVCLDRDRTAIGLQSPLAPSSGVAPHNLAYVIYTSGSTGKPKGVQITHGSVVNFLASMRTEPGIRRDDRLLAVTTLSFDIAGLEIYLPLTVGARIILSTRSTAADGLSLARLIKECHPTIMQATPVTWRVLLESGWAGLPGLKILCGGEALSRELANRLLAAGAGVWNLYGPTETTIWSTVLQVDRRTPNIPIGRPIANTTCYLLDEARQLVPSGVPGELYIGGDGLARGYLNRPELTAEKFVPSPFDPEKRLYRTGDLARYLPDGNIEFMGRLDNQVKLRGFRIELGEIEAALEQQPGIRQAVVVVREDVAGDQRLAAYVTAREQQNVDTVQLRHALASKLPEHMVPSVFMVLDAFQLTANRKVDRRALPAPDYRSNVFEGYVEPRTPTEQSVAAIWKDLLKIDRLGIADNFFDLGGHSLLVVQLQSRLRQRFGRELPLAELLAQPTVEAIAELLDAADSPAPREVSHWRCLVPVRPRGTCPPLFAVVGFRGDVSDETMLILSRMSAHLEGDQPVYGLRPRWVHGAGESYLNVEEMAAECLAEIRTVQPKGPYLLCGYCFAGAVALEIAQQLARQGEDVGLLALVDSFRTSALYTVLVDLVNFSDYIRRRGKHISEVLRNIVTSTNGSRKHLVSQLVNRKLRTVHPKSPDGGETDRLLDLFKYHRRLLLRYRPEPYAGKMSLFVNEEWYPAIVGGAWYFFERYMGWQSIARRGLNIHKIPGDHQDLLTVHSDQLARLLEDSIAGATLGSRSRADRIGAHAS